MTRDALLVGRFSLPGQAYLITTVTANRNPWFSDWRLGRAVVGEMRKLEEEGCLKSMAWVLMPDHLHWLFQLGEKTSLSDTVKAFKGRTGQLVNQYAGSSGPVWQKGFHDRAMRQEDDLPAIARYIVANPLRAGLVEKIGAYPLWDAIWL
ncbi:MAG: hypothetical protein RIR00_509 [Pseudomonadota bacterium]